jgi:nicotinamidase-related amidase
LACPKTLFSSKRLVIAGIETEVCVDMACRRAYSLGYEVVLASDAHSASDRPPLKAEEIIEHHNGVLGKWFAKLKRSKDIQF